MSICVPQDDCCQESDEATRALYSSIKRLDPHHILYSPITGSTLRQAWRYHAATGPERGGTPAFDVYTFEHYELPGVGGGLTTAQMLQEFPLDFAPCWAMYAATLSQCAVQMLNFADV